jgi:hypothetical protein
VQAVEAREVLHAELGHCGGEAEVDGGGGGFGEDAEVGYRAVLGWAIGEGCADSGGRQKWERGQVCIRKM